MKKGLVFLLSLIVLGSFIVSAAETPTFCGIFNGSEYKNYGDSQISITNNSALIIAEVQGVLDSVGKRITNAHVSKFNGVIEDNKKYLGCTFEGNMTCSGSNKVMGISSATNAHAEAPEKTGYSVNLCFGAFESCQARVGTCNSEEIEVVALSSEENAHVEDSYLSSYPVNICCKKIVILPPVNSAFAEWTDASLGGIITDAEVGDVVWMTFRNTGLTQGSTVNFAIYDSDNSLTGNDPDELINNSITGSVDANGHVSVNWTITEKQVDLAIGEGETGENFENFYFIVEGNKSGDLAIDLDETIIPPDSCKDYSSPALCLENPGDLGKFESSWESYEGECYWKTVGNGCALITDEGGDWKCVQNITHEFKDDNPADCDEPELNCIYEENKDPVGGCEEGVQFVTISYELDVDNSDPGCSADIASRTVSCASSIKLPFFGTYGFLVTASLISLIYLFSNWKRD